MDRITVDRLNAVVARIHRRAGSALMSAILLGCTVLGLILAVPVIRIIRRM